MSITYSLYFVQFSIIFKIEVFGAKPEIHNKLHQQYKFHLFFFLYKYSRQSHSLV